MLKQNSQATNPPAHGASKLMDLKPGSVPAKADLPHDFGASVNDTTEREYASQAARNQDPGHLATRSNDERGGRRDAGVGVNATNAGAGSGGDVDPSVLGLDGRGLAENYPDQAERDAGGPDRVSNTPDRRADHVDGPNDNDDVPRGGTVTVDRDNDGDNSAREEGADALNTTDRADPFRDGAGGEVSRGESMGPNDSSSSSARR